MDTELQEDGGFITHVNVAVNNVFFGWVFGFGGKVLLLSPDSAIHRPSDLKWQYLFLFRLSHIHFFCSFRPRLPCIKEFIRCPAADRIHRYLTSPPSLQPGRELRKYHYPLCLSWPLPVAIRSLLHWVLSLGFSFMAHPQFWLRTSCP